MLVPTLITLSLLATPQAPKTGKAAKPVKPAPPAPTPAANPTGLLREAECVLALKGRLIRETVVKSHPPDARKGKGGAPASGEEMARQAASAAARVPAQVQPKTILEEFDYEIPGTLREEAGPSGEVTFTFVPVPSLKDSAARGVLHLEDSHPTYGAPPVVADASEVRGVANFIFRAAGRGQGIVPVSGDVNMMGQVRGSSAIARPGAAGEGVRPVLSTPLPVPATTAGKITPPALVFTGISLWAWANTKGPFTAQAMADYKERAADRSVTGQVQVTFRVGATK